MNNEVTPTGWMHRWRPLVIPVAIVALVFIALQFAPGATRAAGVQALVYLVLALGFSLFVSNSGIISFGHMAFMGLGAYAAAIVSVPSALKTALLPDLPPWLQQVELGLWPSLLVASAVATVFALIIGPILMRLTGIAAGIATLALVLGVQVVIQQAKALTRGNQTMVGIPDIMSLAAAFIVAIMVMIAVFAYQISRRGQLLRAVRDDELAAAALGVSRVRQRLTAFVLSAAICGLGGGMLAFFQKTLSPTTGFFLDPTFLVIVMLVVGGMRSFGGVVVGSLVVSAVTEILRILALGVQVGGVIVSIPSGAQSIVLGLVSLLFLVFRPGGITNNKEIVLRFRRTARRPAGQDG